MAPPRPSLKLTLAGTQHKIFVRVRPTRKRLLQAVVMVLLLLLLHLHVLDL